MATAIFKSVYFQRSQKAFISVRYNYSHFKTDSSSQYSRDYFHTTELWGGYNFGKLQVMAFVPYLSIHKFGDDGSVNSSGLGDTTVLGNYQVFSITKMGTETKSSITNTLWLGGGIKFPTGQSTVDVADLEFTVGDFAAHPVPEAQITSSMPCTTSSWATMEL